MGQKLGFDDFIAAVDSGSQPLVRGLHEELTACGCTIEVKEAKSGYVVSYRRAKQTIANYVFRKAGLIARIYPNHLTEYLDVLDTLPGGMVSAIQAAPPCKRLLDPDACNPRCARGFDFPLQGRREQKCRYSAFQFPFSAETAPHIRTLLLREASAV